MKTGRNDPCPCGSGRKYKQCCMHREGWAQSPVELAWRRLHKQLDGLPMRVLDFVRDAYGPIAIVEAWEEFALWDEAAGVFDGDSPHVPTFIPWLLYCWSPRPDATDVIDARLHDVVPARAWLDRTTHRLTPMVRSYVQVCVDQPFSFYEVKQVEPGRSMTLRDLITGDHHDVIERSATHDVHVHDLVYALLAPVADMTLVVAMGPVALPPDDKVPVIELCKHIRVNTINPPDDGEDTDPRIEWDYELRELYLSLTDELLNPFAPEVVTSEGDAWEFHKLVYDIDSADAAFEALNDLDVLSDDPELAASAGIERNVDGAIQRAHIHWNTTEDRNRTGAGTLLGSIDIDGNRMTAEISSRERAERLKGIIDDRLADHAKFRADTIQTLDQLLAEGPDQPPSPPASPDDPDMQAMVADHLRKHYTAWIDIPVPALDDRTPRDVACTPDGREQVAAMLDGAQAIDLGLPAETHKAIFDDVRQQLGLPA